MIRQALRRLLRFLTSTALVTGLLLFVSAWSAIATFIPQEGATVAGAIGWDQANPALAPVVRALGLHQAFSSMLFMACVLLLGISTAVCSWRRTKVALIRSRTLRDAASADAESIASAPDLEVDAAPGSRASDVLRAAAEVLGHLGIGTRRRGDVLYAVSPWWSVWGSAIFHWSLVALVVVILGGSLLRFEGQMALAVGQTKADVGESYLWTQAGSFHRWGANGRSFRVDAFDPNYRTGGVDRGPTPTVSVLDGSGNVIRTQRVYPNMMLHEGSLSISAPACGLSADLALLNAAGAEVSRSFQAIDFSQTSPDGTVPLGRIALRDNAGDVRLRIAVTVPLDRTSSGFGEWVPKQPTAHVVVTSPAGDTIVDSVVKPGEEVALPGGGRLRLVGIGWYSRLGIVDDWSTPLIYGAMILALLGLTITVATRQQLLIACVVEGTDGTQLVARMRLWRNTPTNRDEIVSELARALGSDDKESTS